MSLTHKQYDLITDQALAQLRSMVDVESVVAAVQDSPYIQDKAKVENLLYEAVEHVASDLDHHAKDGVVERLKKILEIS